MRQSIPEPGSNDFSSSLFSQSSNYDSDIKNYQFETDKRLANDSNFEGSLVNMFFETPQINKKLYMKDLESQNESKDASKTLGKQNNIPNQVVETNPSRKITIHKNSSIIPYRAIQIQGVDQSFSTSKIVQLQQQLINLRKQLSFKQSSWMKQKSMLLNKIEISNFDVAQMKQRNNNLIQINQTLTQALGQTSKTQSFTEGQNKNISDINGQLSEKNKKLREIQDKFQQNQKEKASLNSMLSQQRNENQSLRRHLEEYKVIVKQSSQRKFESDEKIISFVNNLQTLKKKLKSLPIKDEYLNPVYAFLDIMRLSPTQMRTQMANQQESQIYENCQEIQSGQNKYFKCQKYKYQNESFFLKPQVLQRNDKNQNGNNLRDAAYRQKTGRNATQRERNYRDKTYRDTTYRDTTQRDTTQRDTTQRDTTQRDRTGIYFQSHKTSRNKAVRDTTSSNKNVQTNNDQANKRLNRNKNPQRINQTHRSTHIGHGNQYCQQTQNSRYEFHDDYQNQKQSQFGEEYDQSLYLQRQQSNDRFEYLKPNKILQTEEHKFSNPSQKYDLYEDDEQVYLCEVCQRVYPPQDFRNHMKQCQQYEALLKAKKSIQFKLISIKEVEYNNRKSNSNSLNNSAIVLNKSRSKGKFVKHSRNTNISTIQNQDKIANNNGKQNFKINTNNNKNQRNFNKDESRQNSRLQLSELLNISNISNRHSNISEMQSNIISRPNNIHQNMHENKVKRGLINPKNYFTSPHQNQIEQIYNTPFNYQQKSFPQIRYQTNIVGHENSMMGQSNIGKESMQEQIRKIVQALNQGGKSSQTNMKKPSKKGSNSRNPSLTNRAYNEKEEMQNRTQRNSNSRNNLAHLNGRRQQYY